MFWIDTWQMSVSEQFDVFWTWFVKFKENRKVFPWTVFGEVVGVSIENVRDDEGNLVPGIIYLGDPAVSLLWIYTAKPSDPWGSPLQSDCGALPEPQLLSLS